MSVKTIDRSCFSSIFYIVFTLNFLRTLNILKLSSYKQFPLDTLYVFRVYSSGLEFYTNLIPNTQHENIAIYCHKMWGKPDLEILDDANGSPA